MIRSSVLLMPAGTPLVCEVFVCIEPLGNVKKSYLHHYILENVGSQRNREVIVRRYNEMLVVNDVSC